MLLFVSYLLGSVPSSYILGKLLRGVDLRQHGSKNVGFTNAFRCLGWKIGIIVLIFDIIKGFIPSFLFSKFLNIPEGWLSIHENSGLLFGSAAIIGHMYTIFLNFKGGKGVATSVGVFLALTPIPLVITLTVSVSLIFITKFVSLGSITGSVLLPIMILIFNSQQKAVFIISIILGLFIIYKHKENLKRLIQGKELPLKQMQIKK